MKIETSQKGHEILREGNKTYTTDTAVAVSVGGVNLLILTEDTDEEKTASKEGEPKNSKKTAGDLGFKEPPVDNSAIENHETAGQDNAVTNATNIGGRGMTYPSTEVR